MKITPLFLLQFTFIVLKLVGTINWSWWWVLSPTWGVFVVAFVCSVIAAVVVQLTEGKR